MGNLNVGNPIQGTPGMKPEGVSKILLRGCPEFLLRGIEKALLRGSPGWVIKDSPEGVSFRRAFTSPRRPPQESLY